MHTAHASQIKIVPSCSYQDAIRKHPGCPAEVRLGLAACHFRLGHLPRAKKAYERVLQLNPGCPEALYGLAVLRFSSSQGESAKTVGVMLNIAAAGTTPFWQLLSQGDLLCTELS